jgi:hypothetical protein
MAHHFPLKADFERLIGEIVADSRRRQQAGGGRRLSSVGLEGATSAVQTTTRRISTVSADGKLGSGDSAQSLSPEESTISSESVSIRLPLSKAHRITMMRLLLHAADISNPCRHWVICKKWSDRVVDEFFLQGAYEKSQGLSISPNMDRDTTDQFQIALNFGDYIVKPFFELLASFAVEMSEFVDRLMDNRKQWVELEKDFRKRRLLEQQQQQDPHDQLTSPRFAHSRYPVSAPVAPGLFSNTVLDERNLNLPSALHGRRLSFAAGMITLPHKFNQQLKSPTALPHISFEFGGDRDSAFNEADSSHQSISLPRPQANAELDNADRLLKSLSLDKLSGGGALKRNESGETTWAAVTQQQGGGSGNQKSLNRRSRPAEQRLGSIIPENYFEATNSMNAGANRFAGDVLNANEKDPKLLYGSTSLLTASPTSKVRNVRRLSRPQNYLFRFSNKINQLTGENLRIQEQIATENDQPSQSTVNYLSARAKQLESLFDTSNGGTVNPLLTSKFTAEDDGDDDSAEDIEDEEGRLETVDEEKAAATPKPVAPKPTAATTAAAARRPRIFSVERSAEFLRRRFRCFVDGIEKRAAQSNQQLQVESDDFSPLGREKHRIRSTATFADILQQQSNSGKQSEHRRSLSEGLNTPPLSIIK